MNITGRPIVAKSARANNNPRYLAGVHRLPCVICHEFGLPQLSPTQAHHPIHDRGGFRKVPDHEAIPLCEGHHQGDFDTSKIALHRQPAEWREAYGSDRDWIGWTQKRMGWDE